MKRSVSRRYVTLVIFVTAIFVAADLVMLPQSHLIVGPSNAVYLLKAVPLIAFFFAAARVIEMRRPKFPDAMQAFLAGTIDAMKNVGTFLMLFIPLSMASFLFMYLAANTTRPLMDAYLASFDAAIGFDWLRTVELANRVPSVATTMVYCYAALSYELPMVFLVQSIWGRRERVLEFVALSALSGLMTGILMLAVPAAGAYAFHMPDRGTFNHFTAVGGLAHLSTLAQLRTSAPFTFLITNTIGLTSFPSFHTALGIIITYNLRRSILFLPVVVINAIMILATVPEGGHYLVDVLSGAAVGVISILVVNLVAQWSPSRQVTRPASPI
ncbi:membrane-associated phospholipid phosphatase [Mesorhizobium shonense]|uniref:Membrane-associated phospholipid phosphatase n=1 Tax=Mesorhizobium shonense TaxID=1209948 RepID=A0ABV2HRA6_9HYPH|nr:phosphatase PAP2 family protein [Mesorhizobium sp.]TIS49996.1 MAG: phosphatase PAP2 family protein [Mesorhizobium sp.]